MKPIQTGSTLKIEYVPNKSLVLLKSELERTNQRKQLFIIILSLVLLLIVLGSSFLLSIEELFLLPFVVLFFIMTFIGFSISILRSVKTYLPKTPYFFDEVKFEHKKFNSPKTTKYKY